MQKKSAYARKRARTGHCYNRAAWLNVVNNSAPYEVAAVHSLGVNLGSSTIDSLNHIKLRMESAYDVILGPVDGARDKSFDLISHLFGAFLVRAMDIAGRDPETNPMLKVFIEFDLILKAAYKAIVGGLVWDPSPSDLEAFKIGFATCYEILAKSSPKQLMMAYEYKIDSLIQSGTLASKGDLIAA